LAASPRPALLILEAATRSTFALIAALVTAGCGSEGFQQVSETPAGAFEASLATFADGFAVAWYDTRDGHAEIYERELDGSGRPVGEDRRLTTGSGDSYEADIAGTSNGFAVGWYEKHPTGHLVPWLGVWARDGTRRWARPLAESGRNTVVRAGSGAIFVGWVVDEGNDRAGVWAGWWGEDGVPLAPAARLADAGRTTWNLNAAIDPGSTADRPHAWLAFDAAAGTAKEELFLLEVLSDGVNLARITPDDGAASKYPDLALSGDRIALTWFDVKDGNDEVYLAVGTTKEIRSGQPPGLRRITQTDGSSIGAYLAWNADRLGLAWCDDSEGQHELYFQTFGPVGVPLVEPTRLTHTELSSCIPAIKPWRHGFAIAWNEYEESDGGSHGGARSQIAFTVIP
jgi:hypothetical protein